MTKGKRRAQVPNDNTERILELLRTLVIIEGRKAGISVEDIRVILKVKKNDITNITKRMNLPDKGT